MISDVISEDEFRLKIADWVYKNDRTAISVNGSKEDFTGLFRLPEIDWKHTQTAMSSGGDAVSLLKGEISLENWETRSGKPEKLIFYRVMRTSSASPDCEPYTAGYIVVD